jgi:hypothetical protein
MSDLARRRSFSAAVLVAGLVMFHGPALGRAQDCVTIGGCGGDVPSGMCGTSPLPIETGSGCNGVLNCQDPELLSETPTFEVEPLPVTAADPPRFRVRMAFGVRTPWNLWARENNPNGQLQGRWLDSQGWVSVCHSNLADQSRIWVEKTMTCAEMRSTRNVGSSNTSAEKFSLVLARAAALGVGWVGFRHRISLAVRGGARPLTAGPRLTERRPASQAASLAGLPVPVAA